MRGVQLSVDGTPVDPGNAFVYNGVMLSNVPNFAFCVGYTADRLCCAS